MVNSEDDNNYIHNINISNKPVLPELEVLSPEIASPDFDDINKLNLSAVSNIVSVSPKKIE